MTNEAMNHAFGTSSKEVEELARRRWTGVTRIGVNNTTTGSCFYLTFILS
jgi:hypothetical protein